MANWNFPNNPSLGQIYTFENKSWKWDGLAWTLQSLSDTVVQTVEDALEDMEQMLPHVGDTPPAGELRDGQMWLNTSDGRKYSWVIDEDSAQWVEVEASLLVTDFASTEQLKTDLASSSGSTLVGFLQSGSGAVVSTSTAKLQERLSLRDFNVLGNDTTETTKIQQAINAASSSGRPLFIPKSASRYRSGPLVIPSNTTIIFEPGARLRAIDTLGANDRLLCIHDVANVYIYGNGATVEMNKAAYTTGEQRHCIDVRGSTNVGIYNINTNDSGGDGWYVGRSLTGGQAYSRNIIVMGVNSNNNRRQGASVTSVENMLIANCRFTGTIGTNPQSGLDFEPNNSADRLVNILVMNCEFTNNAGTGSEVMLKDFNATTLPVSITYMDNTASGNSFGFQVKYSQPTARGKITHIRGRTLENKLSGFHDLACASGGIVREYQDCDSFNDNTNNGSLGFYSSFLLEALSTELRGSVGGARYRRCRAFDNRGSTNTRRGFASREGGTTDVITDLVYEDCEASGWDTSVGSEFEHASTITYLTVFNRRQIVKPVTVSGTASSRYAGQIYTNTGATTTPVTQTLISAARIGVEYEFVYGDNATNNYTVRAAATDTVFPLMSGVGRGLRATTKGSRLKIRAVGNNAWEILSVVGTWTDVV